MKVYYSGIDEFHYDIGIEMEPRPSYGYHDEEPCETVHVSPIHAELFRDALTLDNRWKSEMRPIIGVFNPAKNYHSHNRDGWFITINQDTIQFFGEKTELIDTAADLVSDETLICEFLDWLYEGGSCPLLKQENQKAE
jgi:hypothetical protein